MDMTHDATRQLSEGLVPKKLTAICTEASQKVAQAGGWLQKLTAIGTGWIPAATAFPRREKTKL
jgi:hypothetical protein